ncbi:MAG: response regulator, partial [Candidatus Omnitrophica bacterium]|nr:response regulator [Candidatus Omnitrophota bacterium]
LKIDKFYKGKGCKKCDFSGWFGRKAIVEILKVDEKIKALITDNAAEDRIFKEAKQSGLIALIHAGLKEVKEGVTSLEEVARVVDVREEELKAAEEAAVEPSAPKLPAREKKKILVVDDEEDIVRVLRMRFKAAGYDVITAGDGQAGVEAAIKEKPDLIVMDVMMPILDGFGATKEIRSRLETAPIPIIMLTAKSDIESELKGIDAGADDYMAKPFEADRLIAHAQMLLKRKERN